jgi:hypothetical protein
MSTMRNEYGEIENCAVSDIKIREEELNPGSSAEVEEVITYAIFNLHIPNLDMKTAAGAGEEVVGGIVGVGCELLSDHRAIGCPEAYHT